MATSKESDKDENNFVQDIEKLQWDPYQSSDWDLLKPSSEALVRMKRLAMKTFVCCNEL